MNLPRLGLLKKMCSIHAPSGNESAMTQLILDYIKSDQSNWAARPEIFSGDEYQNGIVLVFGKPRTAIYAHIDSIGFMTRYQNQLTRIGSPKTESGYRLKSEGNGKKITGTLICEEEPATLKIDYPSVLDPGTDFTFDSEFRENDEFIQSCYLDNRLGVFVALETARQLTNGIVVFSCWEEHGGGYAAAVAGMLKEKYGVVQSLISDITWITEGVHHGKGVVVSIRDSGIPRRAFVNRIRSILDNGKIPYQIEVESTGGSDGNEIQKSPFLIDWCFVGAPEDLVHSPDEKVHKADVKSMLDAYSLLMKLL
jgi:putative aminopeptidase FrvX